MPILSLLAKLGLDKSGFDAGIDSATKRANQFGNTLKASIAGAFTIAAAVSTIKAITDTTNRIKDLSEQYAITTDEVQKADFALEQSGMRFEDLSGAMNRIGQSRRDAVEGNEELRKTFERYGVTLEDLNNPQKRNYDLLLDLADAMSKMNLTAREQVELQDILGSKALRLINVLGELSKVQPPSLISKQDIENIDRAEKALKALRQESTAVAAPFVAGAGNGLTGIIKGIRAFITGNVPEGSSVKANHGGIAGRFDLLAGVVEESIKGGMVKDFASAITEPFKQAIASVIGIPNAGNGPLFKEGKDLKTVNEKMAERFAPIGESGFGRIGAFTGAATLASMPPGVREQVASLNEIKMILGIKGAVIKDVKR